MKLSYKYRLYPNRIQRLALDAQLESCRTLYNAALKERRSFYDLTGKSRSYAAQCAEIKGLKNVLPEFENIHSQTTQQVLKTLDVAYKNFFLRVKNGAEAPGGTGAPGFPRYKSFGRFRSLLFPQPSSDLSKGCIGIHGKKLKVYGIQEEINIKLHRPLPEGARCKQARIVREREQYFIVFSMDEVAKQPLPSTGKITGFDLGITSFLTSNEGEKILHPRPLKRAKDRLIKAQRDLASKKRGSNNRMRAKQKLCRIHQKIVNIRKDFHHKTATKLCRENDIVIFEKLNIKSMLEESGSAGLHRGISDMSWGQFSSIISYKAEKADKRKIEVEPRGTSKMCSGCGHIKLDLKLSDRTYHCEDCGLDIDRDLNAAINISRLGMSLAMAPIRSHTHKPPPQLPSRQ